MAGFKPVQVKVEVQLVPDERSMEMVIATLNLWQETNQKKEIRLMPDGECYKYKVIDREFSATTKGE